MPCPTRRTGYDNWYLDPLTLDAICGHAARTQGQDYTKVTLKKRMEAMASFPDTNSPDIKRSGPRRFRNKGWDGSSPLAERGTRVMPKGSSSEVAA